jgi:hypothetical protein
MFMSKNRVSKLGLFIIKFVLEVRSIKINIFKTKVPKNVKSQSFGFVLGQ